MSQIRNYELLSLGQKTNNDELSPCSTFQIIPFNRLLFLLTGFGPEWSTDIQNSGRCAVESTHPTQNIPHPKVGINPLARKKQE